VRVDRAEFDGKYLHGRLLIGAEDGGAVVVDRRLGEHAIIAVDDVLDCDGGRSVNYIAVDSVITPPRDDDFLSIEPGYWFGRDFTLAIYSEHVAKEPPPMCLEAIMAVNLESAGEDGGRNRPELRVRAYLTKQARSTDGGEDAGAAEAPLPNP